MQIGKETDTTKRTQRPTEKTDRKKMYTQIKVDKQSQEKKKLRWKPMKAYKHPHLVSLPFIDRGLLLECLPFLFQLLPVNKSKNSTNDQENYKKHQNQNPSQIASLCLRFCSPC